MTDSVTRPEDLVAKWRRSGTAWCNDGVLSCASELEASLRTPSGLFEFGDFTLHSGGSSTWRINCEALTDADLDTIAGVMADRIGPVSGVEGVPTGGLRFAAALRKVVKLDAHSPVLIADDVLTTGGSMEEQRAGRDAIGVVLFARGTCPSWVEPVWSFDVAQQDAKAALSQPEAKGAR